MQIIADVLTALGSVSVGPQHLLGSCAVAQYEDRCRSLAKLVAAVGSRTILSQCKNFLALRLTNETDRSVIRRLMPDSVSGLTAVLPFSTRGSFTAWRVVLLPTRIKLEARSIPPDSATRAFGRSGEPRQPSADALIKAVENLRSQTRI